MLSHLGFPQVELVYDDACPNVALARSNLLTAFNVAGVAPMWSEHRIGDPNAPAHIRGYGSPTILVDGRIDHSGSGNRKSSKKRPEAASA